jgi:nitrate/nitrite transporter NarK
VVVAVLTTIPIMLIVYPQDSKAIIPMLISSIILGALAGLAGGKFVG